MVALQALGLAVEGRIVALVSADAPVGAAADRVAISRVLSSNYEPFTRLTNETTLFLTNQDPYVIFATTNGNVAAVAVMALLEEAAKILAQVSIKHDAQCAYTLSAILEAILHDGHPITTNPAKIESWIDSENLDTQCFHEPRIANLRQAAQTVKKPEIYIDILETFDYRIKLTPASEMSLPSPSTKTAPSPTDAVPVQCDLNGEIIVAAPTGTLPRSRMSWRYISTAYTPVHESLNESIISPIQNDYLIVPPTYRTQICRYRHENLSLKDLPYDLKADLKVNGTEIVINLQLSNRFENSKQHVINSHNVELELRLPSDTEKIKVVKGRNFVHDKDNALGKWTLGQKSKGNLMLQVHRYLPDAEFKTEMLLHFSIDGWSLRKMEHFAPEKETGASLNIVKWVKYLTKSGHCSYRISSALTAAL